MLSYAFTTLNQGGYEDVATEEFENMHNLAIFLPLPQEEADGDDQGQSLGGHDGQPDAVHLQNQGQEHHSGYLEQQGTQEGDVGKHRAVAQGGEEGGAEDVEAHQPAGRTESAAADRGG